MHNLEVTILEWVRIFDPKGIFDHLLQFDYDSSEALSYNVCYSKRGIHTYARRGEAMPRGGRECKRVQQSRNWSGEAVPHGIASHVVQYVHSGSIHT